MSHTVPFRLSKPAHIFQTSDSTGFGIRCGVKCKDPKTKEDSWTNYQATIFAKSIPQIEFYTKNLVEGAMVVVSGNSIFIDVYQGANGQSITLTILDARIEAISSNAAAPLAAPRNQQTNRAAQQQAPAQQAPAGFDDFDDDIPF